MQERWSRQEYLMGEQAMARLRSARVALFGLGGVGAAAAEALARGGVGELHLIDHDTVSESNINRQLCALSSTVGRRKVDVVAERVADIAPETRVVTYPIFFLPETQLDFSAFDYVIDAIDTVSAKVEIARRAVAAGVPMIMCMGTGNKLDPTAFEVEDLANTSVCPLARVMRRELRRHGIEHVKVVYSTEEAHVPHSPMLGEHGKAIPGSVSFVPPVAGMIAAGEAIRTLCGIERGQAK
ncbi:MAG: tRNA threonylcarbamoyladenosine dehydratase [Ruminococcaceae bacterium]|nr:tRNA threonylcarbamoyladenosine dehydratase [Oscillospiraceae bacterium]